MESSKLRQDLGKLLSSSYLSQEEASKNLSSLGYVRDPELSTMNTKVFVNESDEPLIIHRGSVTAQDWIDDAKIVVGLGKSTQRLKDAREITRKTEEKYKKPASSIGHSYGGYLAENSGGSGKIITYNKAAGLGDIATTKNRGRQLDVFASGDIVSQIAQKTQTANKQYVNNKRSSILKPIPLKALEAHDITNLFY
jgi:hypothetical protein